MIVAMYSRRFRALRSTDDYSHYVPTFERGHSHPGRCSGPASYGISDRWNAGCRPHLSLLRLLHPNLPIP